MSARLRSTSARVCAALLATLSLALVAASYAAADPHIWTVPGGTSRWQMQFDSYAQVRGGYEEWQPTAFTLDTSVSGGEQRLLVFDARRRQIVHVDFAGNRIPIAGTGGTCARNLDNCGDGGPALNARFSNSVLDLVAAPNGDLLILEGRRRVATDNMHMKLDRVRLRVISARTQQIDTVLDSSRPVEVEGRSVAIWPTAIALLPRTKDSPNGELLIGGQERDPAEAPPEENVAQDEADGERGYAPHGAVDLHIGGMQMLGAYEHTAVDESLLAKRANRIWKRSESGTLTSLAGGGTNKLIIQSRNAADVALATPPSSLTRETGGGFVSTFELPSNWIDGIDAHAHPADAPRTPPARAFRSGKGLAMQELEVQCGGKTNNGIECFHKGPDGKILLADWNRIWQLEHGKERAKKVAGIPRASYNGNARVATTAALNQPRSIRRAPGGGFFFIDAGNNRLRFVGPDDELEAQLVELVGKGTAAINDNNDKQLGAVITRLGELGHLPAWKSHLNHRFGAVNDKGESSRVALGHLLKTLRRDVVRYTRLFVQYNDQLEWMQSLRARMALQTISDRLRETNKRRQWQALEAEREREEAEREREEAERVREEAEGEEWIAQQDLFDN